MDSKWWGCYGPCWNFFIGQWKKCLNWKHNWQNHWQFLSPECFPDPGSRLPQIIEGLIRPRTLFGPNRNCLNSLIDIMSMTLVLSWILLPQEMQIFRGRRISNKLCRIWGTVTLVSSKRVSYDDKTRGEQRQVLRIIKCDLWQHLKSDQGSIFMTGLPPHYSCTKEKLYHSIYKKWD